MNSYIKHLHECAQRAEAAGFHFMGAMLRELIARELCQLKGADFFANLLPLVENERR